MTKESIFKVEKSKCTLCNACVRACPVKAIEINPSLGAAKILPERCVACGSCQKACPFDAINYSDSLKELKQFFAKKETVVALLDPAIACEFPDINDFRKFAKMIKEVGFTFAHEISFSVDLVAGQYFELLRTFNGKYFISANCPVIVEIVEKYYPDLIQNLAPIMSPVQVASELATKIHGKNIKKVYIGPCVAQKKHTFINSKKGYIDASISFEELRLLFHEIQLDEKNLEFDHFDGPEGNLGNLYPISNGWVQAAGIDEHLLSSPIVTSHGSSNVSLALRLFSEAIEEIKYHFNLFYCNGCLNGPGMSNKERRFRKQRYLVDYTNKRLSMLNSKAWAMDIENFKGVLKEPHFEADDQRNLQVPKEKINEILQIIGKSNNETDKGCEACGYHSCQDFATAVAAGLADTEMCYSYSIKNRNAYIDTLKNTNEKLNKVQLALKESELKANTDKVAAQEAMEIITSMLNRLQAAIVIASEDMKIIFSNSTFIEMLGPEAQEINDIIPGMIGADLRTLLPQNIINLLGFVISKDESLNNRDVEINQQLLAFTAFSIKRGKIFGCVFRNLYTPEIREEEAIKRINDVITKNLNMVQKIGFLLGEGAAETEQMLNSIIESYSNTRKGKNHES